MRELALVAVGLELLPYLRRVGAESRGLANEIIYRNPPTRMAAVAPAGTSRERALKVEVGGLLKSGQSLDWVVRAIDRERRSYPEGLAIFDLMLLQESDLENNPVNRAFFVTIGEEVYFVLKLEECSKKLVRDAFLSGVGDNLRFLAIAPVTMGPDRSFDVQEAVEKWSMVFVGAYDGEGFIQCERT